MNLQQGFLYHRPRVISRFEANPVFSYGIYQNIWRHTLGKLRYSKKKFTKFVKNNTNINVVSEIHNTSGFGGLGVACWPLVPKFAGSNPTEAVGIFGRKKNLSTPSFGGGSKTVGPMS